MKTREELLKLIEEIIEKSFDKLWDSLTHDERLKVFPDIIIEYISRIF